MCDPDEYPKTWCLGGFLGFVCFLLTVVLVPLSFRKVSFDEVALKYDKVSRKLDRTPLREGLHNVGPSGQLIKFKTTQRKATANSISTLSSDSIEVLVNMDLFYSVIVDQVVDIFDNFGDQKGHDAFVLDFAIQIMREVAATFNTKQFSLQRESFQIALQLRLRTAFETSNVHATVDSAQVRNIALPPAITSAMQDSTVAQQDIENALSERETQVQAAQIALDLATSEAELLIIEAQRDVAVIEQETQQAIEVEKAKMQARSEAFSNISNALNLGGDFFVESYLKYLVAQSNKGNTIIGV